jgi:nucleotide-binding universal stress UspA family protein
MTTPLLRRIVLATDLGPGATDLLAHGLRLALDTGARLSVVHAHRGGGPSRPWDVRPVVRDLLRFWGHPGAEELAGLDLGQVAAEGPDPLQAIVQAAELLGPDLLLLGTERRQGLDRLVFGSAAERVARRFSVGTLFIGQGTRGVVDPSSGRLALRRVLVPVGDGVSAQDALDAAWTFLVATGATSARIDLHHAGAVPDELPPVLTPPGALIQWRWSRGPVVASILVEAHESDADLIVMVTRGHDSLTDEVIGSRTERVMRDAPCPVLAVPLSL